MLRFLPWLRESKGFPQHPGDWETLDKEESCAAWANVALHDILMFGTLAYNDTPVPPLKPPYNSFCPGEDEDFVHRLKPGIPSKVPYFIHCVRCHLIAFNLGLERPRFQQDIWDWIDMDVTCT